MSADEGKPVRSASVVRRRRQAGASERDEVKEVTEVQDGNQQEHEQRWQRQRSSPPLTAQSTASSTPVSQQTVDFTIELIDSRVVQEESAALEEELAMLIKSNSRRVNVRYANSRARSSNPLLHWGVS